MSEKPDTKRQRRGVGRIYSRPNSPNLWIEYWHLGRAYRESCGSPLEQVARRLLRKRMGEIARRGRVVGPEVEGTTYEDLERLLLDDYRARGVASLDNVEKYRLRPLRKAFGGMRALDIRRSTLIRYAATRRRAGAAGDTVRHELKLLHRMFALAVKDELLEHLPAFPEVEGSPPREGAYTAEQMVRISEHLPERLRLMFWTMYVTGWRGKHVRAMTWERNVDLKAQELRLPKVPGNKKRSRAVVFPYGELEWFAAMVGQQRRRVAALAIALGRPVPLVFPSPAGELIGDTRKAWDSAIEKAEVPRYSPHVTRRSATQNLRRSGAAQRVRMALVGHSTTAMLNQYDADSAQDRAEAVRQLGAYLAPGLTRTQTRTQDENGQEAAPAAAAEVSESA